MKQKKMTWATRLFIVIMAGIVLFAMTVLSVNLRKEFGINIIAIENSGILIETIHPDYVFKKGDILFISGSKAGLNRLSAWAEKA